MFNLEYLKCEKCGRKFYWNIEEQYKKHKCFSDMTEQEWQIEWSKTLKKYGID